MDREWSLDKPVPQYYNENDDGSFKIRVCQNCFSTFEQANVCPYCGAEYETTPVEIQNFKEIELKKVEEEKEAKRQEIMRKTAERVEKYESPEECRNFYELVEYGKARKFKPRLGVYTSEKKRICEVELWGKKKKLKYRMQ